MTLLELTKALVNIPSLTGEESEIANYLTKYLKARNFNLHAQEVDKGRANLFATLGAKPKVVFCTHTDTVPPFLPAWEDRSFIYGRGACDAKGIIACMIQAAQELGKEGFQEIGLLFVVGEEADSAGAKKANSLYAGSNFIIVGEPTENKMGIGHKGMIALRLKAMGKAAHSAFPSLGESAIGRLLDALQKLREMDFGDDPLFGKSQMNIGIIHGGKAFNIIADHAYAEISIRTAVPSQQILERVKKGIEKIVKIEVLSQSDPQRLFTVSGYEQVVLPYGTDIPYLKNFGSPLLIGPGSPLLAHTGNEKIEKNQLRDAVRIYKKLAIELLTDLKNEIEKQ